MVTANVDSNSVSVLLNNGTGGFNSATNFSVGSSPYSVAVGDFNSDGQLDLVAANSGNDNVSVLLNNGTGGFNSATNFGVGDRPLSVAVGDFNGDGQLDLSTANAGGETVSILLNTTNTNTPPVAINDTNTTNEDTAVTGNVLTNDTDVDTGDTLSVSAVSGVAASVGNPITLASGAVLTLNSDGTYSYNPNGQFDSLGAGQTGSDSFTYTVSDGKDGTSNATVNLIITGVNDAPVAVNDSTTAAQNTAVAIAASSLLANDSDVDSPQSALRITGVSGAINGTVTLNNNGTATNFADDFIVFTPTNSFSGNASFSYTLSDGSLSSTATVPVAVGKNLNSGNGNDTLSGTAGNDVLNGQNGQDTLYGLAGNDQLEGGNGDDQLYGGADKDTLLGGNGNDRLWGEAGNDLLTGSLGSDTFAIGKTFGIDTITDFNLGQGDKIGLLNGLTFNQLTFSGNQILADSEVLAVLTGFNTNTFTAANFVSI